MTLLERRLGGSAFTLEAERDPLKESPVVGKADLMLGGEGAEVCGGEAGAEPRTQSSQPPSRAFCTGPPWKLELSRTRGVINRSTMPQATVHLLFLLVCFETVK